MGSRQARRRFRRGVQSRDHSAAERQERDRDIDERAQAARRPGHPALDAYRVPGRARRRRFRTHELAYVQQGLQGVSLIHARPDQRRHRTAPARRVRDAGGRSRNIPDRTRNQRRRDVRDDLTRSRV